MGPRSWLKPFCNAVCFTLYTEGCGGKKKLCSCSKIKSNTSSRQNLSDIRGTFIPADVATKPCSVKRTMELLHSLWNTLNMWQGVNVILLVKFAMHFFFLAVLRIWKQNVLSQCFDRHGQFNPRVRQHNVGSVAEWREVGEHGQKAPHVFSKSSPAQSKWLYVV